MRQHKRKIQQLGRLAGLDQFSALRREVKALVEAGLFTIDDVIAELDEEFAREVFTGPKWASYWETA